MTNWLIPNCASPYASFDETKTSSTQQGELTDLGLAFLVSEETAVRRKSEVKSAN
jgi:hypothetical protein